MKHKLKLKNMIVLNHLVRKPAYSLYLHPIIQIVLFRINQIQSLVALAVIRRSIPLSVIYIELHLKELNNLIDGLCECIFIYRSQFNLNSLCQLGIFTKHQIKILQEHDNSYCYLLDSLSVSTVFLTVDEYVYIHRYKSVINQVNCVSMTPMTSE